MIIILHNIRSLYNVGSIFRTADAAGAEKIYLCGITPAPVDRFGRHSKELAKVSLGAEKYLPWEKTKSIANLIGKLKKDGYQIFAIEQSAKSIPYYKVKTSEKDKTALILGNEVTGLSREVLDRADKILEIPMLGKKESLNVSAAFAIIVYSLVLGYNKNR